MLSFDTYTERARKVMGLVRQEAQRLNHEYIGTEHLLLGLVLEGSGVAANVLRNLGLTLDRVRAEVEKSTKRGPSMVNMGQLPFTSDAKEILSFTLEEASNLGHTYIGTEHLLLGLLRIPESTACRALVNCGLALEKIREETLDFVGARDIEEAEKREAEQEIPLAKRKLSPAALVGKLLALTFEVNGKPLVIAGRILGCVDDGGDLLHVKLDDLPTDMILWGPGASGIQAKGWSSVSCRRSDNTWFISAKMEGSWRTLDTNRVQILS